MKCPYCGREMEAGGLHGLPNDIVYWLPENSDLNFLVLTKRRIEECGGIVLCNAMNAAYTGLTMFAAKERPASYCCKACKAIITKL